MTRTTGPTPLSPAPAGERARERGRPLRSKAPALERPTLLDGGMGTALIARGLPPGSLPEEWIPSRPEEIAAVHAAHAGAGARLLLTCTFNCAAPRLEARVDPAKIEAICGWAERLARSASRGGLVAGALGPTGLSGREASPSREQLAARYARPMAALRDAGVDLLWIESQQDLGEALAALGAARATGLAAAVTFTFVEDGGMLRTTDGRSAEEALSATQAEGAAAAGANCVEPGPALAALAAWARERLAVPFVAKPTTGLPGAVRSPEAFADAMEPMLRAGARLVGGCCGTAADHLRALAARMTASGA